MVEVTERLIDVICLARMNVPKPENVDLAPVATDKRIATAVLAWLGSDEVVKKVAAALKETHLDFQEEPLSMNATRDDIDRLARAALSSITETE